MREWVSRPAIYYRHGKIFSVHPRDADDCMKVLLEDGTMPFGYIRPDPEGESFRVEVPGYMNKHNYLATAEGALHHLCDLLVKFNFPSKDQLRRDEMDYLFSEIWNVAQDREATKEKEND